MDNIKLFTLKEKIILYFGINSNVKFRKFGAINKLKKYLNIIENKGFVFFKNEKNKFQIKTKQDKIVNIRKYSSDLDVFMQIYINKGYQELIKYISKFQISKNDELNVIDAGTNIGLFSQYFIEYFMKSKIIALEPDYNNCLAAKSNFEINKIPNVKLLNGALWKNNDALSLNNKFRDGKDWAFSVDIGSDENKVKSYTFYDLFEILKDKNIDVLKMDIEGSEKYLFEDKEYSDYFLSKTKFIAIEIHDEFDCREMIYSRLKENNFDFFDHGELTIARNKDLVN